MKAPTSVLRWEDPPNARGPYKPRGGSRWSQLAAELVDESGRWALVYEGERNTASALASYIRAGKVKCFSPAGAFEAVTRAFNGVVTVHARHVGAAS